MRKQNYSKWICGAHKLCLLRISTPKSTNLLGSPNLSIHVQILSLKFIWIVFVFFFSSELSKHLWIRKTISAYQLYQHKNMVGNFGPCFSNMQNGQQNYLCRGIVSAKFIASILRLSLFISVFFFFSIEFVDRLRHRHSNDECRCRLWNDFIRILLSVWVSICVMKLYAFWNNNFTWNQKIFPLKPR